MHAPLVVDYRDVLADPAHALAPLPPGCIVRLESPGGEPDVLRGLLLRGVARAGAHTDPLGQRDHPGLEWTVLPPAWGLGFAVLLAEIDAALGARGVRFVQHPREIALCFDKVACSRHLARARVPVPRSLGSVASFADLREAMRAQARERVFLKPRYGSSASGCVAVAHARGRWAAWTTVQAVQHQGVAYPTNTKRIRMLRGEAELEALLALLSGHELVAEAWVPKAGIDGCPADLRLWWIEGRLGHGVVRLGRGPMTNLHLGGERRPLSVLLARMSRPRWQQVLESCARVVTSLPGMSHVGIDVAVATGLRAHRVLEVNAFGDELRGVTARGRTPQQEQARRLACALQASAP